MVAAQGSEDHKDEFDLLKLSMGNRDPIQPETSQKIRNQRQKDYDEIRSHEEHPLQENKKAFKSISS